MLDIAQENDLEMEGEWVGEEEGWVTLLTAD